jgi:ABC-type phosphate transport system permease subunit
VLSALPVVNLGNACCCLWVICGGVLGAYLDQQNDPRPITVGRSALTGFLSGIIGSFVWLVMSILVNLLLAPIQRRFAEDFARDARNLPPEVRTMLESLSANPSISLVFGFLVMLFAGVIFATLGGVLGAAFFRSDDPPALGGPSEPPPLPPQ